jgi:CheY-like chemotaxis protein
MSAVARGRRPIASGEREDYAASSNVVSVTDSALQIIVVEDDPSLLYIAQKRLRAAGFRPIPASNGLEAIERMAENPRCRRMVTDFYMPSLGGDAWIRYLEANCEDWTIVVMSSEDIDSGRFIVLPKPVDFENLLEVFHRGERQSP